jgi:predicted ABC-type ATPase
LPISKELVVVAGPNGSGKTTFAQEYLSQHVCTYLSADLVAERLSPGAPEKARLAAGRQFLGQLRDAIAGDDSVLIESTLSGRRLAPYLRAAREAGFAVRIVMIFLDSADTCVARVQERARKGGHAVPEADVRRRFDRSIRNFWTTYRFLADHWVLIYNGGGDFQDVVVGAADRVSVRDERLFNEFRILAGRV